MQTLPSCFIDESHNKSNSDGMNFFKKNANFVKFAALKNGASYATSLINISTCSCVDAVSLANKILSNLCCIVTYDSFKLNH